MTAAEVLAEMKKLGTAQNRKVYARHGVGPDMFGVSYADLKKLQKRIKVDQKIAEQLWDSGNHDARVLATMVADAAAITPQKIERWTADLDNYVLADAFSMLAGRTASARKLMEKWSRSKNDWLGQVGWNLLAHLVMRDRTLDDAFFEKQLAVIVKEIHTRKNRTRHAMNGALIAIGLRNKKLQEKALAAAARIGRVEVDHGETGCKTPDAAAYIRKAAQRKRPT